MNLPLLFVVKLERKNESGQNSAADPRAAYRNRGGSRPRGPKRTPERVAKSYAFLLKGYSSDLPQITERAIFTQDTNNMIVLRDIEVYSLCEHHMLPFFGQCHVGYISKTKVLGVSKIARIVDCYARRLQIQERLTQQIARAIMDSIDAEGVGVVMEC